MDGTELNSPNSFDIEYTERDFTIEVLSDNDFDDNFLIIMKP